MFSQISTVNNVPNPMMNLPLRSPKLKKDDKPHACQSDVPSLLFYYLFDDWYASYSLVSRSGHQYGNQLEQLVTDSVLRLLVLTDIYQRKRMFTTADLKHINQLHQFGRQLAVLKRMYQSYDNIIQRVLERSQDISPSVPRSNSKSSKHTQSDSTATEDNVVSSSALYGVPLSTAAKLKFERLNDRVKLLTLTEIQDCLDEKEALVMLVYTPSMKSFVVTDSSLELQSYCYQGVLGGGTPYPNNDPFSEGHHLVHACELDDRLFLYTDRRSCRRLHSHHLLGLLRGCHDIINHLSHSLWAAEWNSRGEANLQITN